MNDKQKMNKVQFDKWYELRQFILTGIDYIELPLEQRKAYSLVFDKMEDLERAEERFNK